jgi:hypothetical protein
MLPSGRGAAAWAAAWAACALLLAGCASVSGPHETQPAHAERGPEDRDAVAALLLANAFQAMQRLVQSAPAEQAELLTEARAAYERTPQGSAQLRYALLLATPGHPARDPVKAQTLLRDLAASPEALVPIERAVTLVELAQLDRELGLAAENQRLAAEKAPNDHDRIVATQRRLQAELEENGRLRKQVEDAQAKLDAIAKIERNAGEQRPGEAGRGP